MDYFLVLQCNTGQRKKKRKEGESRVGKGEEGRKKKEEKQPGGITIALISVTNNIS